MNLKEKTMQMKNWAVVGATNKKERYGYKIVKSLKEHNYNVFPIHPKLTEIEGLKVYPSLKEVPARIDVVVLVVNPQRGIKIMDDIIDLGIKYVWLQPGSRSAAIREKAQKHKIIIIEDCIYAALIYR